MNKKVLALCSIALMGASATIYADDSSLSTSTVFGGTINFTGTVVNAACAVDSTSTTIDVPMGQVRTAQIDKGVGTQSSDRKAFQINLGDCDPNISRQAAVSFNGVTEETENTSVPVKTALLAGSANGASNGVALQIFDSQGQLVVIDNQTKSAAINLIPNKNTIRFDVGWVSLVNAGEVKAGDASASVDFNMNYF